MSQSAGAGKEPLIA